MSLKRKAADLAASEGKKPKANASITSFFAPPKNGASNSVKSKSAGVITSANGVNAKSTSASKSIGEGPGSTTIETSDETAVKTPFDKKAWAEKLTAEQKDLLGLEIETLDESWFRELKDHFLTESFLGLKRFLKKEHAAGKQIFPPAADVYSWSRHTPLNTVKAVVIGQDPYHNHNQAHGLSFSVRPPTIAPPSLKNIYKAISNDYPDFTPPPNKGGLLTPWADRGVLLLNTCLTVRAHEANSHANWGWEPFTQKIIDLVAKKRTRGVVFLAWGSPAGKRVSKVDKKRHLVLQSVHPSPLSASRGWFECGHFKKTNEWLVGRYGEDSEIDWNLNVAPEKAGV